MVVSSKDCSTQKLSIFGPDIYLPVFPCLHKVPSWKYPPPNTECMNAIVSQCWWFGQRFILDMIVEFIQVEVTSQVLLKLPKMLYKFVL